MCVIAGVHAEQCDQVPFLLGAAIALPAGADRTTPHAKRSFTLHYEGPGAVQKALLESDPKPTPPQCFRLLNNTSKRKTKHGQIQHLWLNVPSSTIPASQSKEAASWLPLPGHGPRATGCHWALAKFDGTSPVQT